MIKRRVLVYKYESVEGQTRLEKVFSGEGLFQQYGCDYEEFESGPGNFSTAIVEMEDGTVENVSVEMIEFKT